MSESIIKEALFSLHCIGMGVLITFVYDLLRVYRACVRHSRFCVSLEDFLFWILCAVFIFSILYRENDGILRWYCIAGAVFGMELYRKTVSPYIVYFMSTFLKKTIHIVAFVLKKILFPFRLLFSGVHKIAARICRTFTKKKKQDSK